VLECRAFSLQRPLAGVRGGHHPEPYAGSLDWHDSLQSYAAAKARIFSRETVQSINFVDDPQWCVGAQAGAAGHFGATRQPSRINTV